MKIKSVKIENFRCFKNETISFNDYTCFVGQNGAGKSTVLYALNLFFRQYQDSKTNLSQLSIDDFHHKDTTNPIKVTVTFTDLSDEAKEDLSAYVRQDKLIVSAVARYDPSTERAEVKQYGSRLGIEDFREFFEAEKESAKVAELKEIYGRLKEIHTELPNPGSKQAMIDALHAYELEHSEDCVLIPSEDQFYGVSKGANRLAKYIQWVFVSASKDASEEGEESKKTALGELLARTVRSRVNFKEKVDELKKKFQEEYQGILDAEQEVLSELSSSLEEKLEIWSHPGIETKILWKQDSEKSVKVEEPNAHIKIGEKGFDGDLARFGHGLQRSFMLALLQELTSIEGENAPTLVMGIEEPELYQHPPQAKYLAETLQELTLNGTQIFTCTHSPLFILGDDFETIRMVREKGNPIESYTTQLTYRKLSDLLGLSGVQKPIREIGMIAKLYPSINATINEMFFCNILIVVEGIEDLAHINSYLLLMDKMHVFRRYKCHIVPVGGKSNIIKPLAIANLLQIPTYVVCDADTNTPEQHIGKHKKDNKAIQYLLGISQDDIQEWPENDIVTDSLTMWKTNITDKVNIELDLENNNYKNQASTYYGNAGGLTKNPLAVAKVLELAWDDGVKSSSLEGLITRIMQFAEVQTRN